MDPYLPGDPSAGYPLHRWRSPFCSAWNSSCSLQSEGYGLYLNDNVNIFIYVYVFGAEWDCLRHLHQQFQCDSRGHHHKCHWHPAYAPLAMLPLPAPRDLRFHQPVSQQCCPSRSACSAERSSRRTVPPKTSTSLAPLPGGRYLPSGS